MRPIGSYPPPTGPRPGPTPSPPPAGHTPRHPLYNAIDRLIGLMLEVVPAMKRTGMSVSLCAEVEAAVKAAREELCGAGERAKAEFMKAPCPISTFEAAHPVIAGIDPGAGNDTSSTPTLMGDVLSTLGESISLEAPTGRPPHKWTEQEKADCAAAMRKIVNGEVAVPVLRFDGPGALKEAVDAMHKNGYDHNHPVVTGKPTGQDANAEVSMFAGMTDAQIAYAVRRMEQNSSEASP